MLVVNRSAAICQQIGHKLPHTCALLGHCIIPAGALPDYYVLPDSLESPSLQGQPQQAQGNSPEVHLGSRYCSRTPLLDHARLQTGASMRLPEAATASQRCSFVRSQQRLASPQLLAGWPMPSAEEAENLHADLPGKSRLFSNTVDCRSGFPFNSRSAS